MNVEPLAGAIVGHLVGDYLLQNDWMATHKKESWVACYIHCLIWTECVLVFSGWWLATHGWNHVIIFLVLMLTHYFQDQLDLIPRWMDMIGQRQFRLGPCAPWSTIVVDNTFHILTIWLVWRFVV